MEQHVILSKMSSTYDTPIQYFLSSEKGKIELNSSLGKNLNLKFLQKITCIACSKETKKSFFNGFCYTCFQTSPEAAECIVSPELCRAHLYEGRDPEWEQLHHNQQHVVYLAISSHLKVGITRKSQLPTRWIDQGATQAIVIAETHNRYLSGLIEVFLKSFYSDKTSWQKMLKNESESIDLLAESQNAKSLLVDKFGGFLSSSEIVTIDYPLLTTPDKVISVSFDKTLSISGVLTGIKGQYLIFDGTNVFNIRRHSGYHCLISN